MNTYSVNFDIIYRRTTKLLEVIRVKFIHTADWHIGRKLQGIDLLLDQQFVLENLIADIKKDNIDFIIIAGDLYDRSVPSKEATILLQELLVEINIENNKHLNEKNDSLENNKDLDKKKMAWKVTNIWMNRRKLKILSKNL